MIIYKKSGNDVLASQPIARVLTGDIDEKWKLGDEISQGSNQLHPRDYLEPHDFSSQKTGPLGEAPHHRCRNSSRQGDGCVHS